MLPGDNKYYLLNACLLGVRLLRYDLHTHSTASDGILSPENLVSRAKDHGIDKLAITDHDTVAGIAPALCAASVQKIDVIAGIEFSTCWKGRTIHVVGLNIDHNHTAIVSAVKRQTAARHERAVRIDQRLQKLGIQGALASALALAGDSVIGRPHFAQFLVQAGYVKTVNAAFKQYLGAGKAGDIKQVWPELDEVVAWICAAGGVAVLAHPGKYKLTRTKLCRLTEAFKDHGGKALEVISGRQDARVTQGLGEVAAQFGLYASCGSDFHIPDQPWQELGAFGTLPPSCIPVWDLWS